MDNLEEPWVRVSLEELWVRVDGLEEFWVRADNLELWVRADNLELWVAVVQAVVVQIIAVVVVEEICWIICNSCSDRMPVIFARRGSGVHRCSMVSRRCRDRRCRDRRCRGLAWPSSWLAVAILSREVSYRLFCEILCASTLIHWSVGPGPISRLGRATGTAIGGSHDETHPRLGMGSHACNIQPNVKGLGKD